MALRGTTNAEKIWNFFLDTGMHKFGIAGLMGNLDCESALNPKNLEDSYQSKLGYTDDSYTAAVDTGVYTNFVKDCAGYGLAQFTWHTRKQALLNYARSKNVSIGDLEMQLEFIMKELNESHKPVLDKLNNPSSIYDASTAVLKQYECPAIQSDATCTIRASASQKYYNMFSGMASAQSAVNKVTDNNFKCSISPVNGYYKYPKGSKIQLEKNFWSYEFDCHGVGCCSETIINASLVKHCQQIRDHFGTSVTISSPYRCVIHNGGTKNAATNSRHTKGDAADIVVSGHSPSEVAKYAESIGILGIGLYETSSDGYFVHIDERDYKSFWYGQSCSARTTFGGSTQTQSVSTTSSKSASTSTLSSGSTGDAVIDLQNNLIKLGFSVGSCGADGNFGYGTLCAVREYQRSRGLTADGIAGILTLNKIKEDISNVAANNSSEYVVTANILNIRSGAGMNYSVVARAYKNTILTITEIKDGWGKMEAGWVSMQYCQQKG